MVTKGYGLTAHDIDVSCPADLEPYEKAYALEQKNKDAQMWAWWGIYGSKAVLKAIDLFFNGKNSKVEYTTKPFLEEKLNDGKELTEDEINKQRMLHRLNMETLKANFELTHPKEKEN